MDAAIFDVVVLGAGPAGAAAACEASRRGLEAAIVDEQRCAGGQVYCAVPGIVPPHPDRDRREGDVLRQALETTSVARYFGCRVWHIEADAGHFVTHALGPQGPVALRSRTIVVATGALERHVPFAGWELPGVMGLAAATVLLKAQRMLPGRRVVVAGSGPLLYAVAKGVLAGGGDVAAVVDSATRTQWWRQGARLASRPDLALTGIAWVRALRAARIPVLRGHALKTVDRNGGHSLVAEIGQVTAEGGWTQHAGAPLRIECDAVCVGSGLLPATDVTRVLRVSHAFDERLGGWHALVDDFQRSDVRGVYVAGDGAGIEGAASARAQGQVAALAVALDLARIQPADFVVATRPLRAAKSRAAHFGQAMTTVAQPGRRALERVTGATVMCLCEGLTRQSLEDAIAAGCSTLDQLRSATRCGMGPCGGRLCEDAAAGLLVLRTDRPRCEVGQPTGRSPLRPVEIDAVAGDFDYAALPLPAPAPA